ncbi:hypothetical protein [Virgibacillus sp. Bac330]|uniref:hypothetical protein n=1 Tax=Virgibacillus sp. Bac330 TaxID=2419841 RepID=UPI000EF520E8|nr:hypothetical protein [Virgibacillus sp. Bac330]
MRAIIHTILYHPEQIHVHQATSEQGIRCGVRKVYQKSPIANGRALAETVEGKAILNRLEQLKKEYEVSIPL